MIFVFCARCRRTWQKTKPPKIKYAVPAHHFFFVFKYVTFFFSCFFFYYYVLYTCWGVTYTQKQKYGRSRALFWVALNASIFVGYIPYEAYITRTALLQKYQIINRITSAQSISLQLYALLRKWTLEQTYHWRMLFIANRTRYLARLYFCRLRTRDTYWSSVSA